MHRMPLYLLLADGAGDAVLLTQDAVEVCYSLRHRRLEADGGAATEGGLMKSTPAPISKGLLTLACEQATGGLQGGITCTLDSKVSNFARHPAPAAACRAHEPAPARHSHRAT